MKVFKIENKDILDQEADIMVISFDCIRGHGSDQLTRRVHTACGELSTAMGAYKELKIGDMVCTPGYNLSVKEVFHVSTPKFWDYRDNVDEALELLKNCYISALILADKKGVESVVFPLLGQDFPRELTEKAADLAIEIYQRLEQSQLNVYIIIPPDDPVTAFKPISEFLARSVKPPRRAESVKLPPRAESVEPPPRARSVETPAADPDPYIDRFAEYDRKLEEAFRESGKKVKGDFYQDYVLGLLRTRITNIEATAELVGYQSGSSLRRLINGDVRKPNKSIAIALAIAMNLSDEERYSFIRCAGHNYPENEQDRYIEHLIFDLGLRDFKAINKKLAEKYPGYLLVPEYADIPRSNKNKISRSLK